MDNRPIGIFDSGVGGLTVVREMIKALPNEEIVYFGDTARVPYGSKSQEVVTKFSTQIVNFMLQKEIKTLVIACGTISSNSYHALKEQFDVSLFEVITPGVEACLEATKNNIVGVIGTEATIRSGVYEKLLKQRREGIEVYSKACPLFVPLAEEGWLRNSVALQTAEIYLQKLIDRDIDCIVLGCTHYPLLVDCISRVVGGIQIVNPAEATARKLKQYLLDNNMQRQNTEPPEHTFFVSDNTTKFDKTSKLVLNQVYPATIVDIETY